MRKLLLVFGLLLSVGWVHSQDIHFSQFNASPLTLNPALTGAFDGCWRFVGNQRRQWGSVTTPFQTFGISADAATFMDIPGLGVGLSITDDRAGDSRLNTLQVNLSGSYALTLNSDSTLHLSVGFQPGFTNRRIDFSELEFDQQYNGIRYDPDLANGENFGRESRTYLNLNAGINWQYYKGPRERYTLGAAIFNGQQPNQSFIDNTTIPLDMRWLVHYWSQIRVAAKFDVLPAFLLMRQGPHTEFNIGGSVKYIVDSDQRHYRALYAGAWTRAGDAGFVSVGMDYDRWNVGLSYDLNYSRLSEASGGRGGWEVSLIYILPCQNQPPPVKFRNCPLFL